jgi:hypothetical protein
VGGSGFVDVRDNNDAPMTAIGTGTAIDNTAKPSLLVFKARSTHRINDSTTGSYQTLDAQAGASGPMAVTQAINRVVFVNEVGVWETDGISSPTLVSAKLQPLFTSTQLNFNKLSGALVTTVGQRVLISLPFGASQATNNLTLEFNPLLGWFASHDFGLGSACRFQSGTSKLYGGGPVTAKVYDVFTNYTDDGAVINARYQTRWFTPAGDNQNRVQRVRLFGRGTFQLYFKIDYQIGDGLLNNVALTNNGFQWNAVNWNAANAIWGPLAYEGYQDFHALGVNKACAFLFKDSSTTAATGPNLLQTGAAAQVGSFACYGLKLDYVPLGLS